MQRSFPTVLLVCLSAIAGVVWYAVVYRETHRAGSITVLNVGQGDAILIDAGNGNQLLIDGGPSDRVLVRIGKIMPFWDKTLEVVLLTHPHADHLTGLIDVLKRYRVERVFDNGDTHTIPEYTEWENVLAEKKMPRVYAQEGQKIILGERMIFSILAPIKEERQQENPGANLHARMVVGRFDFETGRALFMGDAEEELEYRLIARGNDLKSDILKVGHHGSKTSTSDILLERVEPQMALISAGRKNRFGHPHEAVMDRLKRRGIAVERTDLKGDITIRLDDASRLASPRR